MCFGRDHPYPGRAASSLADAALGIAFAEHKHLIFHQAVEVGGFACFDVGRQHLCGIKLAFGQQFIAKVVRQIEMGTQLFS